MVTGMDLKVERLRAHVQGKDLAEEMGLSHGRVSQIEALAVVRAEQVARYRDALLSLTSRRQNLSEEGVA